MILVEIWIFCDVFVIEMDFFLFVFGSLDFVLDFFIVFFRVSFFVLVGIILVIFFYFIELFG